MHVPLYITPASLHTHTHTHTCLPLHAHTHTAAYEPPPDMMFIPPVERVTLTHDNQRTFSESHDIKLRISKDYWNNHKDDKLDVCLCAAMSLNRSFPAGYTVVSPVVFVSARSRCPCKMSLSIPHAAVFPTTQGTGRIVILSTTTVDPNLKAADSPLFSPSERTLAPLPDQGLDLQAEVRTVTFKTYLVCPSLFAVAIKDNFPRPLPLRCSLFVAYPQLDRGASVAGFDIETYIGMNLMTVTTVSQADCGIMCSYTYVLVGPRVSLFPRVSGFYVMTKVRKSGNEGSPGPLTTCGTPTACCIQLCYCTLSLGSTLYVCDEPFSFPGLPQLCFLLFFMQLIKAVEGFGMYCVTLSLSRQ